MVNDKLSFADKIALGLKEGIQFAKDEITLQSVSHSLVEPVMDMDNHEVTRIREELGLSRNRFAAILNVSEPTVQGWETGKHKPSRPAIRLLQILQSHPTLFQQGLHTSQNSTEKLSVSES